jgi:hypothetical protein
MADPERMRRAREANCAYDTATVTIRGIELAEKIKKDQFNFERLIGKQATTPQTWAAVLAAVLQLWRLDLIKPSPSIAPRTPKLRLLASSDVTSATYAPATVKAAPEAPPINRETRRSRSAVGSSFGTTNNCCVLHRIACNNSLRSIFLGRVTSAQIG